MKVELCVSTLEAALLAKEVGVDRIETCVNLEQGGLTPTRSMVDWIDQTLGIEQHVLIRSKAGGFTYSNFEEELMQLQIQEMRNSGAKGVVVGVLTHDKNIKRETLKRWMKNSESLDFTFHRAFDHVPNWKHAIDVLVDLGFKRILTSGSMLTVDTGIERIESMISYASNRIEIMAGGGVSVQNIPKLVAAKVDAIHFSGTEKQIVEQGTAFEENLMMPNKEKIELLKATIQQSQKLI